MVTFKDETVGIALLQNGNMSLTSLNSYFPEATGLINFDKKGIGHLVALSPDGKELLINQNITSYTAICKQSSASKQINKLETAHSIRVKGIISALDTESAKRKHTGNSRQENNFKKVNLKTMDQPAVAEKTEKDLRQNNPVI